MGLGSQIRFLASPPKLYTGDVVANWQSGVASSGLAGADFLTIGGPTTMYYAGGLLGMPLIFIYIGDLTPGATITYRLYITLFGVLQLLDEDDYIVGADPDIMTIFAWTTRGEVRIEVQSNDALDNGAAINYEYALKTY